MKAKKIANKEHLTDGSPCWCNPKIIKVKPIKKLISKNEWEKDNETEKLITSKNIHSVLHICPTHGSSCYMPLENTCPDCKLYLSGKDIRHLLDEQRQKTKKLVIKEILKEVIGNGSADRTSIITMLTHKYGEITGLNLPIKKTK